MTTWLWWAPLGAAALHIVEEFVWPGGFGAWDRAYRPGIRASITAGLHVAVNALLIVVCIVVGLLGTLSTRGGPGQRQGAALWLTIAALLAWNAFFHLRGTIASRRYSPGLVTALVLYVPMAVAGYVLFLRSGIASPGTAVVALLLGASYPLWSARVHAARSRRAGAAEGSRR